MTRALCIGGVRDGDVVDVSGYDEGDIVSLYESPRLVPLLIPPTDVPDQGPTIRFSRYRVCRYMRPVGERRNQYGPVAFILLVGEDVRVDPLLCLVAGYRKPKDATRPAS